MSDWNSEPAVTFLFDVLRAMHGWEVKAVAQMQGALYPGGMPLTMADMMKSRAVRGEPKWEEMGYAAEWEALMGRYFLPWEGRQMGGASSPPEFDPSRETVVGFTDLGGGRLNRRSGRCGGMGSGTCGGGIGGRW